MGPFIRQLPEDSQALACDRDEMLSIGIILP
jgi:hypothetical protein